MCIYLVIGREKWKAIAAKLWIHIRISLIELGRICSAHACVRMRKRKRKRKEEEEEEDNAHAL